MIIYGIKFGKNIKYFFKGSFFRRDTIGFRAKSYKINFRLYYTMKKFDKFQKQNRD